MPAASGEQALRAARDRLTGDDIPHRIRAVPCDRIATTRKGDATWRLTDQDYRMPHGCAADVRDKGEKIRARRDLEAYEKDDLTESFQARTMSKLPEHLPEHLKDPLVELLLALADDKLVLGHRNSDWTGLAPILEEDIAFSSLAQDEIAHARSIYELAATLTGRSADELAFGREPHDFRSAAIVELPDDFDWVFAICRQLFCDHFDLMRLRRMARSSYQPLADLASRLAAEEQIHVEHADAWLQRLGTGTEEAEERMQAALRRLARVAASLFEPTEGQTRLEAAGVYPPGDADAFEQWSQDVGEATRAAGLTLVIDRPSPGTGGGRHGEHTEYLRPLLDEMCEVHRLEPRAAW